MVVIKPSSGDWSVHRVQAHSCSTVDQLTLTGTGSITKFIERTDSTMQLTVMR
jgi:hypothetical protein